MPVVNAFEVKGVKVPAPCERIIKVIFAPDLNNVPEATFSLALIQPNAHTDYHTHDRPELIYVVYGWGEAVIEGKVVPIGPDSAIWSPAGEKHQIRNTGDDMLKVATVFVPAYTSKEIVNRCLSTSK